MRRLGCVLGVLVGCGPTKSTGDDTGATSSATMTSETSSATVGTVTADGTAGIPTCEMYASTPDIGPAVTIAVRSEATTPLFFDPVGCGGGFSLSIAGPDGIAFPYQLDGECSPNTCEGFLSPSDCLVGCNDCAPPNAGRIEAGASGETTWNGQTLTQLPLDPACVTGEACPDTCVRPDQTAPGTYTISLTAYRTCTGTCDCDPPTGVCGLWNGDEILSDPVTFSATVEYPAQTSVEIVLTD